MTVRCLIILAAVLSGVAPTCRRAAFCNAADATTYCGMNYELARLLTIADAGAASGNNAPSSCAGLSSCIIFFTASTWNGNFGGQPGIAGADARCNSDSNKPADTGSYKALIVGGTSRRATLTALAGDSQIDWVLYASKEYRRPDGTIIGTSNSVRLFTFPLTNAISATDVPGAVIWTGLVNDWTTHGSICLTWTDNTVGEFGITATESDTGSTAIQSGNFNCSNAQMLYCVQQ